MKKKNVKMLNRRRFFFIVRDEKLEVGRGISLGGEEPISHPHFQTHFSHLISHSRFNSLRNFLNSPFISGCLSPSSTTVFMYSSLSPVS